MKDLLKYEDEMNKIIALVFVGMFLLVALLMVGIFSAKISDDIRCVKAPQTCLCQDINVKVNKNE